MYPRRVFLTWAAVTPAVLIVSTLAMQEFMRRFLMNAFDARSAMIAGYNASSLELCRRLQKNPGMRLEVTGFFDDRSTDRLGHGVPRHRSSDRWRTLGPYVQGHIAPT